MHPQSAPYPETPLPSQMLKTNMVGKPLSILPTTTHHRKWLASFRIAQSPRSKPTSHHYLLNSSFSYVLSSLCGLSHPTSQRHPGRRHQELWSLVLHRLGEYLPISEVRPHKPWECLRLPGSLALVSPLPAVSCLAVQAPVAH